MASHSLCVSASCIFFSACPQIGNKWSADVREAEAELQGKLCEHRSS